jgi:hypothetical protein
VLAALLRAPGGRAAAPGIAAGQFAGAARPAWAIIAGLGAVVLVLALATTGQRGRASAERAAALITRAEPAAAGRAGSPA